MTDPAKDGEPEPVDPFTAMLAATAQLHEMFKSMIDSGFSEYQACVILGTLLGTQAKGG